MSKRRKRESDFEPESSETEEKENTEKEKVYEKVTEKAKVVKPGEIRTKKIMLYSVVIAVVFFGAGFLVNFSMTGFSVAAPGTGDQFIFISPPGCTNCAELEPMAKGVADTLGLPFSKTGFGQQIPTPGFVLIYDNVLTVSGFQDEYTLNSQMCVLTENEDVCNRAEELKPVEQPQPQQPQEPQEISIDEGELTNFIGCLKDSDFKIYGANWCGWTKKLVTMLGGFDMIKPIYTECTEQKEECDKAGVQGYPTIVVKGQIYQGERTFKAFSDATGCPIPSGAETEQSNPTSSGGC